MVKTMLRRWPMLGVSLAFWAACFSSQPSPSCDVVPTQDATRNPPYLARMTSLGDNGSCTAANRLSVMRLGVQAFVPPTEGGASLALKPERLVDMREGRFFRADVSLANNCQAALDGDPDPQCQSCTDAQGVNPCRFVDDPIPRIDQTDPTGSKLVGLGGLARQPTRGQCTAIGPFVAEQSFDARSLMLTDGGTATLPSLFVRFEFVGVSIRSTARLPGTVLTAELTHTEGSCVARYRVDAFYPAVSCTKDADCDSEPRLDAGLLVGSGVNPLFQAACDTSSGWCVPSVDLSSL
jgi:hypothetical protein